jgi:hypothetical protein
MGTRLPETFSLKSVYPLIVARQRLGKNVTALTNTHTKIKELLDESFSMSPVSYEGNYAISSSLNFLLTSICGADAPVFPECIRSPRISSFSHPEQSFP